jgi:hypothetical protein
MGASDLRVTVDQPKLRCVLHPALALGHPFGPQLALGLTRAFETWLTRSFWQVLDASEWLARRAPAGGPLPDAAALCDWIALRDSTDAGSWALRWVGDNLSESQTRGLDGDGLLERFEWLAEALAARGGASGPSRDWGLADDPLHGALDAVALSAALEGALLLSPVTPSGASRPGPIQALASLDIAVCESPTGGDASLYPTERLVVRQALAAAGLAPLVDLLLPLAVVHALVLPDTGAEDGAVSAGDPWSRANVTWYLL